MFPAVSTATRLVGQLWLGWRRPLALFLTIPASPSSGPKPKKPSLMVLRTPSGDGWARPERELLDHRPAADSPRAPQVIGVAKTWLM